MTDISKFFDRVVLISLSKREDRRKSFTDQILGQSIPWDVEYYQAIDGSAVPHADWWTAGNGAWGCYRSHLNIIERALNEKWRNVLIFEDDAKLVDNFQERLSVLLDNLPEDWDMLYLGGQHTHEKECPPIKIAEGIATGYSINRTHCYAINGKTIETVYRHLTKAKQWAKGHHIDHHLETMHRSGYIRLYCANPWLVGQGPCKSDISGRMEKDRIWDTKTIDPENVCDEVTATWYTMGYGTLGIGGNLGYENKYVSMKSHKGWNWLSAHAPSRVWITVKSPVQIIGAVDESSDLKKDADFLIDNKSIGTLKEKCSTTPVRILEPGSHSIEIRITDNRSAHTLWGFSAVEADTNKTESEVSNDQD